MASDSSEPDWGLLPYQPEEFFGLDDGYDRKDLKRKYNKLLRQFKPEKFPEEFQKIRAAFESLDNQLRYGTRIERESTSAFDYEWNTDISAAANEASREATGGYSDAEAAETNQKTPDLAERLKTESPEEIYRDLELQDNKTPFHYFALAILSDTLPGAKPIAFAKWLLAGLKAHAHDPGLFQMLQAYLRSPVPKDVHRKLLLAISKIVTEDRFYFLTEPLWDQLLRNASFKVFAETLRECERNLTDYRIGSKLAFYIHIMKPAHWLADEQWIREAYEFIEDNSSDVPFHLESDIEVLYEIREYMQHRADFAGRHPLCAHADRVVKEFCLLNDVEFDPVFLAFQVQISSDVQETLNGFPSHEDDDATLAFFNLWQWINLDVAGRLGVDLGEEVDPRKGKKTARTILQEIEQATDKSNIGQLWNVCVWLFFAIRGLSYVGLWCLIYFSGMALLNAASQQPAAGLRLGVIVLATVVGLGGGWSINRFAVKPLWGNLCMSFSRRCYKKVWRGKLLAGLQRTFMPFIEMRGYLFASQSDELTCSVWVSYHFSSDFGLAMYSMSQRFQT